MPLIRHRALAHDAWQPEPDGPLPDQGDVIVSLARWRREAGLLTDRRGRLGLQLSGDEPLQDALDALPHVALVVLRFNAFNDGRGYTQASLLRRRFRYRGELRAAGELLPDQLRELERCGVDSVVFDDAGALDVALRNYDEIDVVLQPAEDGELVFRRRAAESTRATGVRT